MPTANDNSAARDIGEQHQSDLVWGAASIAKIIGKTPRATFHMLELNQVPGAKKIGNQWVLSRARLAAFFSGSAAA